MTDITVRRRGVPISALVASPLALLLLGLAVGAAAGHSTARLTDPVASPTVAVVGTTISFQVRFTCALVAAAASPVGVAGMVCWTVSVCATGAAAR